MFSALKEGLFKPTISVEYTDDEVGFATEGHGGGRVVREEVMRRLYGAFVLQRGSEVHTNEIYAATKERVVPPCMCCRFGKPKEALF